LYKGDYRAAQLSKPGFLERGGDMPSYVPARSFAIALIDIVASQNATSVLTISSLRAGAQAFPHEHIRRALLSALDASRGDIDRVREHLEHWFDTTLDRVSGWRRCVTLAPSCQSFEDLFGRHQLLLSASRPRATLGRSRCACQ
jgi:hypothetical protein